MQKRLLSIFLLTFIFAVVANDVMAQRRATRRGNNKRTTTGRTQTNIQTPLVDTVSAPPPVVDAPPPPAPVNDSLPIKPRRSSLRRDEAVDSDLLKGNLALPYEHLRAEDAAYRHKIWREIDTREKMNTAFRYAVEEDNGNQRFMSIVLQSIQDSLITVFSNSDDRFTTPMTKAEVAKAVSGDTVEVPIYNESGELTGTKKMLNEVNLDSIYKFRIKEEVIFDKESSRLFWRIIGIAPLKNIVTSMGVNLGETELFWMYYPEMRPILVNYDSYNGKNFGARMNWEQVFESRMFYGRIVKSTIDNPYDIYIKSFKGLQENTLMQLYEGENIKEQIFNYEQDLWSY
jgi:gliding motility associated protien GldN